MVIASDGRRARSVGPWTAKKLVYVQHYAGAFMRAMAPKRRQGKWDSLVYIDPLAGPGICVERNTGIEYPGSPLRAANIEPGFDRYYFSDLDANNIAALKARLPKRLEDRIDSRPGDCNERTQEIVSGISPRTLGLAFLDPEGFEVHFDTLKQLARRRIDILYLFPSGIGIRRNLERFCKQRASPMDDLWGSRDWRELPPAKLASGTRLTPDEALNHDRPWVLHFRSRVASLGLIYQDEADPVLTNERNVPMYHLLFFSKDQAGLTIWRGIKRIEPGGQRTLGF
jgi:three-Cys-motif partner protein